MAFLIRRLAPCLLALIPFSANITAIHAQPSPNFAYSPYDVRSQGAACDAKIIWSGVQGSTSSPNITALSYAFTAADIGATITVSNPAPINSDANPTGVFTGTISNISGSGLGNTAILSGNLGFTPTTYQYAQAVFYHTDDTAKLQAQLNLAVTQGSTVFQLPPGNGGSNVSVGCATGLLTFYSHTRFDGPVWGGSYLVLKNGANSDLLRSNGFTGLIGTNSTGGVVDVQMEHFGLMGNLAANTGSCDIDGSGTGHGFAIYGSEFTIDHSQILQFAGNNYYSEWSSSAGSPFNTPINLAGPAGMETHINYLKSFYSKCHNFVYNGPHDSNISFLYTSAGQIASSVIIPTNNATPVTFDHSHFYNQPAPDFEIRGSNVWFTDGNAEDGILLRNGNRYWLRDSYISGLTLGKSGDSAGSVNNIVSSGVYYTFIDNSPVPGAGNGSGDIFTGGAITTNTGTYAPCTVLGVSNKANNVCGASIAILNGASFPFTVAQSSGSAATLTNNSASIELDSGGVIKFNGSTGLACSGAPTGSFATIAGLVTHC